MRLQIALAGLTRSRARRLALLAPLALLLTLVGGDRSAVAIVDRGIDPLEVLNLYVRPNVIIVLDASGSMTGTVGTANAFTGDHPRSRFWQAKEVIKNVVQQNQSKVNFQMGAYTQLGSALTNANPMRANAHGSYRFQYVARTDDYPAANDEQMETGELTIMGDLGRTVPPMPACNAGGTNCDAQQRGLQSWQIVGPGSNRLVYNEGAVTCTVDVNATKTFYREGGPAAPVAAGAPAGTLAAALEAAMNGCGGRPVTPNVYRVSYAPNTGIFTIHRQSGANNWRPRWSLSTIRGRFGVPPDPGAAGAGPFATLQPYMLLIRRPGALNAGNWGHQWRLAEANVGTPSHTITSHQIFAGAYFNGEVVRVDTNGTVCGVQFPTAPLPVPAKVTLQPVGLNCGADTGTPVDFVLGGGRMSGNQSPANCAGYTEGAGLRPCDQNQGDVQLNAILPVIDREVPVAADGTLTSYSENPATLVATVPASTVGGARAAGNTPIANSLQDIRTNFNMLWSTGQVACPAGPPSPTTYKWDVQHCPDREAPIGVSDPGYTRLALDPISAHTDPKERTIVLFVTDGDDTCTGSGGDNNALWSAARAQALYTRIVATEPASSVQTYVLGYGNGATPNRLNWIAWGGSGLVKTGTPWSSIPSVAEVAACKARGECQDAFLAPDAETLAGYLQGIINQGVSSGEFVAQTPVFPNVYEFVGGISGTPSGSLEGYNPLNPETRYKGFVPLRVQTSFVLPGFRGKATAYGNVGGVAVPVWEASAKMTALDPAGRYGFDFSTTKCTGGVNQCTFTQLKGPAGTTDQTIATATAAIKRRIYTTSRNGVFPVTTDDLVDVAWMRTQGSGGERVALWPPPAAVAPADYTTQGSLDAALGLPTTTLDATAFGNLQSLYGACLGLNLPAECSSATVAIRVRAARREAREMILAFMAGAEWVVASDANPQRYPSTAAAALRYQIQYQPRGNPLADATYGTPAVISVPASGEPSIYGAEYAYYRDGGKDSSGNKTDGTFQGFGLRNPDKDDTTCPAGPTCTTDGRPALKPQMTVAYVGSNDMLHAFRAGCSDPTGMSNCYNTANSDAGQELWGFVPYDQLSKLALRLRHRPAKRDPHDYMISTGLRFADVFVPGPLAANDGSPRLSTLGVNALGGLWRRVLMFGRGQEGKYLTALDVTAPGPYPTLALASMPPIVLWNRGNPDTQDGTLTGTKNNTLTNGDFDAYKLLGETWSVPTISRVKRLGTRRKPCVGGSYGNSSTGASAYCSDQSSGGVEFVSFVGSGYGEAGTREGYALFTLDTLTGDVVAYADVEAAAVAKGWDRSGSSYPGYRNAIVADPAAFEKDQYVVAARLSDHPASALTTRVYVADLHGRAWKFVAVQPDLAIPFADLGADQPVAVGAALIQPGRGTFVDLPHVYMIAGNETRAAGPFQLFGLYDEKPSDTDTTEPATTAILFTRTLQPTGAGVGSFRGTLPPVTFYNNAGEARVAYGATRFNAPGSPDAPAVPPYPCRSSFDSVVYGLKSESGSGAYNLPQDGGAAQFIQGARILSLAMIPDPPTGQGGIQAVAGQVTSIPAPPAPGPKPEPYQTITVVPDKQGPAGLTFRNSAAICSDYVP